MSRGKQNRILGNIKKNSKNLDAFNNIFQEKAEHNRFKTGLFFNQVASVNDGHGCLPSERNRIPGPHSMGRKLDGGCISIPWIVRVPLIVRSQNQEPSNDAPVHEREPRHGSNRLPPETLSSRLRGSVSV